MEIFEKDLVSYLSGDKFSNGLVIELPRETETVFGRINTLSSLVNEKSVIHFGYCDHLPLVEKKIKEGKWLHKILSDVSSRSLGLDVNEEAVIGLEKDFGITNGYKFDLFEDVLPEVVEKHHWDYLVMGEILEHVDNPVLFLNQMREKFQNNVSKLVVTVPNAFDMTNLQFLKRNSEFINTDHRYWFTPYTLAKVAFKAGLTMDTIMMCDDTMNNNFWRKFKLNRRSIMAETIIGVFDFCPKQK